VAGDHIGVRVHDPRPEVQAIAVRIGEALDRDVP
jgi:hypothetical protein